MSVHQCGSHGEMIGTQAIVAYPKPDGTMAVFTSPVTSYGTQLQEGNLSFHASHLSASFFDNQMVIYAVIELPENTTSVGHVWQDGSGIMMPLGFMAARYLKAVGRKADPFWFYVHITLQLPGYLLGMAGGATGLYLGIKSVGVHHPCHMGIGITLSCLGLATSDLCSIFVASQAPQV
ncbi:hypothetical protein RHMOL_Rhmol02G0103500 [Rhododendron molle]|uniref:Uncharacterized protein n=1 Tax=Rhododendron molle TaxID=49168 RepID=A0ACC0PNE7_RHOML|nr:hypothetical protein RHMOL_Rhmol02G0103500 [Rhododendron molle]